MRRQTMKAAQFSFGLVLFCYCISCYQRGVIRDITKISAANGDAIYIKRLIWGLTSDNQITVISNSPDEINEIDSIRDYVFKDLVPFVYKLESNKLIIYTMQPAREPSQFDSSKIRVIQTRVSNPEYMDLIYKLNTGVGELKKI